MDLKQFRFREFVVTMVDIIERLQDSDAREKLLDAARLDTPIIDEILRELALLNVSGADDETKADGNRAMSRDMAVLLTLRHLNQQKRGAEKPSMFPRVAAN